MNRKQQLVGGKLAAQQHVKERRALALKVFQDVDDLVDREIARSVAKGQPPTCTKGCSYCCRQETYAPRAEVEAIVEWLETSAPHLIPDLKTRIASWLDWYRTEYPKLAASGIGRRDAFHSHGPPCPALVDDVCSIYPVRPVFCRTYYVTSPVDACRPQGDPARPDVPIVSMRIFTKTADVATKLRVLIESQGADFNGTVHLLAEWLAHLLGVEAQPWRTAAPVPVR
ncbi:MAG TPA: YkgJ family cysteine cluster protein [Kofleriaceae bacterium]